MNIQDLESKKLPDLREIAKAAGIKKVESFKKAELIDALKGLSTSSEEKPTPTKKKSNDSPVAEKSVEAVEVIASANANAPEQTNGEAAAPKKRKRLAPEKVIIGAKPVPTKAEEPAKTDLFSAAEVEKEVTAEALPTSEAEKGEHSNSEGKGRDIRKEFQHKNKSK